jgi:Tol biopolymer transport system component
MVKAFLSAIAVALIVTAFPGCDKNKASDPTTPSPGPVFAIHDGEQRPDCAWVDTRTDLVSPQTVDSANWGTPVKVSPPVNDNCPNDDSEISADGKTLYFYWSPGLNLSSEELLLGTTGVYYAQRTGGPGEFGTPHFLELRKGAVYGGADGHPRVTPAGDKIYFHSTRAENTGYLQTPVVDDILDIYTAELTGNSAGAAVNLGAVINSAYPDGEQGISPDGKTLYFESKRPGGLGNGDIYYSTLTGTVWSAPVNIGAPINTADNEGQVAFAANDPTTMYFTSDRNNIGSAIYRSYFNGTAWETPVLVVQGQVGSPSLTADGSLMYFVHVLTDNTPDDPVFESDIYYLVHK